MATKNKQSRARKQQGAMNNQATEISDQTPSGIAEASSSGTPSMGDGADTGKKNTGRAKRGAASHRATGTGTGTTRRKQSTGTPSMGRSRDQRSSTLRAALGAINFCNELWDPEGQTLNNRRAIIAEFTGLVNAYNGPGSL